MKLVSKGSILHPITDLQSSPETVEQPSLINYRCTSAQPDITERLPFEKKKKSEEA